MDENSTKTTPIVFGTGICMQNNWKLIQKYFRPKYFADNDPEKWHTFPAGEGIECISPDEIKETVNPKVLVAVGDPYNVDAIQAQMANMGIECETIVDLLEMWGETEDLPKHLVNIEHPGNRKRILLFNSPEHDNVGDHLISISEIEFIKEFFPEYECIEITDMEYLWFRQRIYKCVEKEDIILITGGGFLGSMWLYNGEMNVRGIIEDYPDNQVIIMPQTIYFEQNNRGQAEYLKTQEIYGGHKNLTICLRDKKSFELVKEMLGEKASILYFPDMALFLNYSKDQTSRKGALFCLRTDKESIMGESCKNEIKETVENLGIAYEYTLMHTGSVFQMDTREREIAKKVHQVKSAEIVMTDTLHCMILCAITGTPCLAFDNLSAKISGVYAWIKRIPYIHLYKSGEDIDKSIRELLDGGSGQYDKESLANYYTELARMMRRKN